MHEHSLDGQRRRLSGREIAHSNAGHASVAENLLQHRPVPDLDPSALGDTTRVCGLPAEGLVRVDDHDPDFVARQLDGLRAADRPVDIATDLPRYTVVAAGALLRPLP